MRASVDTFDTTPLSEGARLRYWNEAARQVFDAIEVAPASRRFAGRLRRRRFGAVQLATVDSTPVAVQGAASTRLQGLYLMVNEQGSCEVTQQDRQARLRAGDLTLLWAHEPYRITCASEHRTHVLYVPGLAMSAHLQALLAEAHRGADSELLTGLVLRLARLEPPLALPHLRETVLDLLQLTWPPPVAAPARSHAQAWRERLHHHVEQHLHDPALDTDQVAAQFGISRRYVQQIFAREGTTLSRWLLERRLHWVADRLHEGDDRLIGAIALEAGFSDLSHFCRAFRARFGVSASLYRQGG